MVDFFEHYKKWFAFNRKYTLQPLAKSVLISSGLTSAAMATDATILKEILRSIKTTLKVTSVTKLFFAIK